MIAIITYDSPHRKTQDLVAKLILNGYFDIRLIVIPWVERNNFSPIYVHRPGNPVKISTELLCQRLGIEFVKLNIEELDSYFSNNDFEHILIAGAGILPESLAVNHKIINSHPGYLPNVKGLDAFKWAIYNGQPIGATTHYISDKADEGVLIERRIVPVYFEDTFHSVAYRLYETEIDMLVSSISLINKKAALLEPLNDDRYEANRRMPHHLEIIMMERFEEIRRKSESSKAV